jgi:LPXTG-motif cell wall-anchored protein
MRTPVRIAAIAAVLSLAALGGSASAVTGAIYDSIPSPQPSNLPSLGFQATQTAEFGDDIAFAAGDRALQTVNVYMSSWACENWATININTPCATTPGATFTHPITLNFYNVTHAVGGAPVLGAKFMTLTKTFTIPYRPSADATCPGGTAFKDAAGQCKNGLGFVISFTLNGTVVPDEIVYGIAYNTNTWGANPLGVPGPYESLNLGLAPLAGGVGTDVNPDLVFWNTMTAGNYADAGAAGVGTFRADTNWRSTGTVAAQFITVPVVAPTTTVVAAGGPVPTAVLAVSGALPGTGGSTSGWLIIGGLLMLAGLAIAMKARRPTKV